MRSIRCQDRFRDVDAIKTRHSLAAPTLWKRRNYNEKPCAPGTRDATVGVTGISTVAPTSLRSVYDGIDERDKMNSTYPRRNITGSRPTPMTGMITMEIPRPIM